MTKIPVNDRPPSGPLKPCLNKNKEDNLLKTIYSRLCLNTGARGAPVIIFPPLTLSSDFIRGTYQPSIHGRFVCPENQFGFTELMGTLR